MHWKISHFSCSAVSPSPSCQVAVDWKKNHKKDIKHFAGQMNKMHLEYRKHQQFCLCIFKKSMPNFHESLKFKIFFVVKGNYLSGNELNVVCFFSPQNIICIQDLVKLKGPKSMNIKMWVDVEDQKIKKILSLTFQGCLDDRL